MPHNLAWWCWSSFFLVTQLDQAEAFPKFDFETTSLFGHDVGNKAAPFCMDMDADGDVDCLVGNSVGLVQYFENKRAPTSSSYDWEQRFTNFFGQTVGSEAAPFCGDFDGDGMVDCLVGGGDGLVSHFVKQGDLWTRVNISVFAYDVGSSAKPFCTDLDDDGLVDCLVGAGDGFVYFMKRQPGAPVSFSHVGRYFGERNFGMYAAVNCVDVDSDGSMECLVGNSDGFVALMQRENDTWVERSTNMFNRDFGDYAVPFCVDLDKALDCLVGDSSGFVSVMKQSTSHYPYFVYEGVAVQSSGYYAAPSCADLDNDGTIECLVGDSTGGVSYYGHVGTGLQLVKVGVASVFGDTLLYGRAAPACFDMDNDGAPDCMVGEGSGHVYHYRFYGVGGWSNLSADFFGDDVGSAAKPFCADMGGTVSCLVGGLDGTVRHYRQTGPATFEKVTEDYFRYDVGKDAAPTCTDLDHDGLLDCLVGHQSGTVAHFRNTTSGWVHASDDFFGRQFGSHATPYCADIDGDGRTDCLVGSYSGEVLHMRARESGAPEFTWEFPHSFPDIGLCAQPFCVDLDQDGNLECLMGTDSGKVMLFEKNTSATRLSYTQASADLFGVNVGIFTVPSCFDTDGDGDLDCLVGNRDGFVYHVLNNGSFWMIASTNFFSLDVGSFAAPFCVDMDGDGDVDCLVGDYNGLVHYWRKDGSAWTYVTANLFQYDVGQHARPFCMDLDGDGDMDCLVGQAAGPVVQFRNVGSPSSFTWVVVTRNYFNIATPYGAPFCFDIDADGDMDCIVGQHDGNTRTFKQQEPYSIGCALGGYLKDNTCHQCAAGKYGTRSASSVLVCEDCPDGTTSDAGSTLCRQTFVDWVKSLSMVHLSSEHDGHGLLDMSIHVPPLPYDLHEGLTLGYFANLQGHSTALGQGNSSCAALWKAHPEELKLSVTFEQLGLECTMDMEVRGAATVLTGHAELSVRVVNDGNRIVKVVGMPLELHVPRLLNATYDVGAHLPTNAPVYVQPIAGFVNILKVFQSASFDGAVAVPFFQEGDQIFVKHSTDAGPAWTMSLVEAWLSTSPDPSQRGALVANLTNNMTALSAPPGQIRFSFLAVACEDCVLHVMSQLQPASSRRLSPQVVLATTSLSLHIVKVRMMTPTELYGTLDLAVADPEMFVSDPHMQQAVGLALRAFLVLPPEVRVAVGLRTVAPNFLQQSARTALASYLIIIPAEGLPDGRTAADVIAALSGFMFANLNLALHETVGNNAVNIVGRSEVTHVNRGGGGGNGGTVLPDPVDGGNLRLINVVVVIVGIGVGSLACCAVVLRQWLKRRKNRKFFKPSNNNTNTALFSLIKVTDRGLLACLSELFTPPAETLSSLGRFRDKARHPKEYSRLVVRAAWSVHAPEQQISYEAKKAEIAWQRQLIDETKGPKRTDPTPALTDGVAVRLGVNTSCNEKLLMWGAKVNEVELVLHSGIAQCDPLAASFGRGVYLAEDCSKIDESTQADTPICEDGETKHLHRLLYEKHGDRHPGEVYYAFVCQASLGCPVYTKGPAFPRTPTSVCGPTNACEEGLPIFVDGEPRCELLSVPGTSPPIPYNSLIVEKGRDSVAKLHREFVVFDNRAVLAKYLIAYSREGPESNAEVPLPKGKTGTC